MITIDNKNFGRTAVGEKKKASFTVKNQSNERQTLDSFVSDNPSFIPESALLDLQPDFPASSNIFYWDDAKTIQNANGEFATTNKGYGKAGTTNANRKFIPKFVSLAISITAPVASTEFVLDEAFDVEGTNTGLEVIIEAQNDSLDWVDITVAGNPVSVTAGAFSASCKFQASDGFSAGNPYTIRVKDSVNSAVFDTVSVSVVSDAQGLLTLDANCSASASETLENIVEIQTMDATCSASAPTSI